MDHNGIIGRAIRWAVVLNTGQRHISKGIVVLLLLILQHNFIVTIDQIVTAARQTAANGHLIGRDLCAPRLAQRVAEVEAKLGLIHRILAAAVVNASGD